MKYYSNDSELKFSWDQVVTAFWKRYPNPYSKHVISEDVVERKVVGDKLLTKRLICKTNSLPKWGERFVHGLNRYVYVVEESILDLETKTLTTYTRNIGMQRIMSIDEKCSYTKHLEVQEWSTCQRQAWINSELYGFSRVISSFGLQRFRKNVNKAVAGFNYVLCKLYQPETFIESKSRKEKLKESAQKAKEYAKSSAETAKTRVSQSMRATKMDS